MYYLYLLALLCGVDVPVPPRGGGSTPVEFE